MPHHPRLVIEINDTDGRRLAAADIEVIGPSMARASLHVESGHIPMGTRPRLVDAVLDEGNVASCTHLLVAVPLGHVAMPVSRRRSAPRWSSALGPTRTGNSRWQPTSSPPHPRRNVTPAVRPRR